MMDPRAPQVNRAPMPIDVRSGDLWGTHPDYVPTAARRWKGFWVLGVSPGGNGRLHLNENMPGRLLAVDSRELDYEPEEVPPPQEGFKLLTSGLPTEAEDRPWVGRERPQTRIGLVDDFVARMKGRGGGLPPLRIPTTTSAAGTRRASSPPQTPTPRFEPLRLNQGLLQSAIHPTPAPETAALFPNSTLPTENVARLMILDRYINASRPDRVREYELGFPMRDELGATAHTLKVVVDWHTSGCELLFEAYAASGRQLYCGLVDHLELPRPSLTGVLLALVQLGWTDLECTSIKQVFGSGL